MKSPQAGGSQPGVGCLGWGEDRKQTFLWWAGGGNKGKARAPLSAAHSLGPFNVEDEVVIAEARDPRDGTSGILTTVEADEGKALGEEETH